MAIQLNDCKHDMGSDFEPGLALVTLVVKFVIEHRLATEARDLERARSADGTTHDATLEAA